jgi:hypothetical protein
LRTWLVGTVAGLSIAIGLRSPYGQDGADQMTVVTFGGLTLAHVSGSPTAGKAFLWFVAGQACLSYMTAGLAKLGSAGWRDGSHLISIFNTQIYGFPQLATYLSTRPALATLLARFVIFAASCFPLVLLAPRPLAILFLLFGIMFHATAAVFMGLNTFLWSFLAAYPAIMYCSRFIDR